MPAKKTLLGTLANHFLTRMSRGRLPQIEGELTLTGMTDSVEIFRDRWGIPHIYAQSTADAFFAQGFVHAQDRLFQMELNRRIAAGRLSELFGELALDTDRVVRTFGFNRLGHADLEKTTPEMRAALSAYTAGINAFIEHPKSKLPLEMRLLRFKPDPWEPLDSVIFSRLMIWELSHAWESEIARAEIAEKVGVERAAELEIHYPGVNPVSLPEGIEFNALDPNGELRQITGPYLHRGKGSNEWVISPSRSETGHAVLCNDMHLAMGIPSLWYEVHLNAPDYHVNGVSLPGLPMVLVGHNERIAWGMTLAFTDAEDLFVEQIDVHDPPRYLFQDKWHETKIIEEPIKIKGTTAPHIERVLVTRHGPVISDQVGYKTQQVAVKSMALQPLPALKGWYRLNTANNWDEFVEAMRLIEAPQLNVAYADVDDNIGYWVTGKVPIRAKGDGSVPVPGWSGEYEWVSEVPFEEMPHALNPELGFLVNCNNKIVTDEYPHFLGNVWTNGYRAQRITELIESQEKLSMQDHQDFQMDLKCLPGLELVSRLEGITDPDEDVQLALKMLKEWDGFLTPESVGGAVYKVVRYTLVCALFEPGLGQELTQKAMGKGFHPLLSNTQEFYGYDTVTLLRLLDTPDSWWVQQAGGHDVLISRALQQAVSWLRNELGPDEIKWEWGKLHRIRFQHQLSLQKPFDQVFDRGPFPIGGDTDTPMQTAILPDDPYDNKVCAPSFRQIIDMGDLSKSISIHPPGQSGQLASPHYDDLAQLWLNGEYHPMLWTRAQVESEAKNKLVLKSGATE
jgi:penicillin amidase